MIIALTLIVVSSCNKKNLDIDCTGITVSYINDIKPITDANCAFTGCHVTGFANGDYTSYVGLKAKVDNGQLKKRAIKKRDMPPSNTPGPKGLTDTEIQLIFCWIEDGGPNN